MGALLKVATRHIILVAVFQMLSASCSAKLYPLTSNISIASQAEKKMLDDFLASGIEKMPDTHNTCADDIVRTAEKYLGVPHCMGGASMKCVDCSGLLVTVFAAHNIQLPHNSEEQARYGNIIAGMNDLRKGDMVFFIRSYQTNRLITHAGIYIGDNQFIHTSSSQGVTITSLSDPWWNEKFIFGTRVFTKNNRQDSP